MVPACASLTSIHSPKERGLIAFSSPFPAPFYTLRLPRTQNLDHNVPGGKLNRGMSVVDSVEIIKGRALSDEEYLKAGILGWCIELVSPFSRASSQSPTTHPLPL